ncbi:MAG TPA: RNA polymerase sigma-70 factor [Ktedonobacterales bacterium]|jgi:RNA polymerase sigma-70 factor (ECF subfamily)
MEDFETYRSLLFAIAYRMLGRASEAEDMVQETYLRYRTASAGEIRSLKSYLTKVVTNLCLDELKSARVERERYLGPWLPEPILTSDPGERVELRESLSLAFLLLLETLSPPERAAFLLHEVFDYSYEEVGEIIGKNAATCRQLVHRARAHLAERRPRFQSSPEEQRELLGRFLLAAQQGEMDNLTHLLAREVVVWSDGGGKVSAALRPILGQERVIRFVLGLLRKGLIQDAQATLEEVNGGQAMLFWRDETLFLVTMITVVAGQVHELYGILNPEKLAYLQRQLRGRASTLS